MNRKTETLLLEEIAPRLRAAIPKTIPMVGPEDPEELLQDGLAIAIGLLQSVQRSGKKVSAGNIAHYTILALRSGRRSTGIRKNDVLAPACQLNGHARVRSMDEPLRNDEDGDEPLTLHDCLAADADDPATAAARRLDWDPDVRLTGQDQESHPDCDGGRPRIDVARLPAQAESDYVAL